MDSELLLISRLNRMLDTVDAAQRERVLKYLSQRYAPTGAQAPEAPGSKQLSLV